MSLKAAGAIVKGAIVKASYRTRLSDMADEASSEGEFSAFVEAIKEFAEDLRA